MDRDTLYLDNDEEITSVIDKLKGTNGSAIDLVIPKESLIFQGVVNLKLLRKQAESLGKEITIVTQDKVGTKLAEQIGIPVIAKVGQTPKVVKMSEAEELSFSEDDIELKEAPEEAPAKKDKDLLEETDEVVPAVAAKEQVENLPKEEVKAMSKKAKKANWQKKLIAGGFVVLAIFAAAYVFVPLANVSFKIAAAKEKLDIEFKADKAYTEVDGDAEVIPAKVLVEEKEITEKYQATGKKDAGEKASGTVTLYNAYDDVAQTIVAGSRIANAAGLVFRLNSNVTIPAGTVTLEGGKPVVKAGTVTLVAVTADKPGEKYNIAPTTLYFPGFAGTAKYSTIYAKNSDAFTGGSTRTITYVTAADITKAKTEIAKSAENELRSTVAQKIGEDEQMLEKAIKFEQISAEPSKAAEAEATDFELRAKYKATAIIFKDDDLKKLAEKVLGDKIGSTKEIVESGSLINTTEFVDADFEKGIMNARLSGEAYIAEKLDQEKMKVELAGEGEANAAKYLSEIEGIGDVQIKFFPSFYKRMPRIKSHIYLKPEIIKE